MNEGPCVADDIGHVEDRDPTLAPTAQREPIKVANPSWTSQKPTNLVLPTRFFSAMALPETREFRRNNSLNGVFGVFSKTVGP